MTKNKPSEMPSPAPPVLDKRGCTTSFLTEKKNEMDEVCGGIKAKTPGEYIQPEEEKETGGEA